MAELELRQDIVKTAQQMVSVGLVCGTSGNVSARYGDGFLITPSAVAYKDMSAKQIVYVGFDGSAHGICKPSSEWRFHKDIYLAKNDAHAIVHCHSPSATALSTLRLPIPAFHYMVAIAGGSSIPCADYATFGSQALSNNILTAMRATQACLMANHGQVVYAESVAKALELAIEVENLANQYAKALQIDSPFILDDEEMQRVLKQFKKYKNNTKDNNKH